MPNNIASNSYSMSIVDRSVEKSTTQIGVQAFADNPAYVAARATLETELIVATEGTLYERNENLISRISNGRSGAGQRELKWKVSVSDNVTFENFSFTLPTADVNAYTFQQNSDLIDLAAGNAPALKSAIEGFYATPRGNIGTVTSIELVGRNL